MLIGLLFVVSLTYGEGTYPVTFTNAYPASVSDDNAGTGGSVCYLCHTQNGNSTWNPYGNAIKREMDGGRTLSQALAAVEGVDSDGDSPDGWTNLQEITNGGQPGWTTGLNTYYDGDGNVLGTLNAPAGIPDLDPDPLVDSEPVSWGRLKLIF